jgi:hypothetical protein
MVLFVVTVVFHIYLPINDLHASINSMTCCRGASEYFSERLYTERAKHASANMMYIYHQPNAMIGSELGFASTTQRQQRPDRRSPAVVVHLVSEVASAMPSRAFQRVDEVHLALWTWCVSELIACIPCGSVGGAPYRPRWQCCQRSSCWHPCAPSPASRTKTDT